MFKSTTLDAIKLSFFHYLIAFIVGRSAAALSMYLIVFMFGPLNIAPEFIWKKTNNSYLYATESVVMTVMALVVSLVFQKLKNMPLKPDLFGFMAIAFVLIFIPFIFAMMNRIIIPEIALIILPLQFFVGLLIAASYFKNMR